MTDLIEAPGASTAQTTSVFEAAPPSDGDRPLEWAPSEPAEKKHRTGLWVGIGIGALILAGAAASTILIAPGTTIAGIPVGGLTPGAAADVVGSRLANVEITLTDVAGEPTLSGADLGASLDARALADEAFTAHPMWNLGAWLPEPIAGDISLDTAAAHSTLRALVPTSYQDAVDAGVVFDAPTGTYVTTAAEPGTAVDLDGLKSAVTTALADGESGLSFSAAPKEAPATVSDKDAATTAATMNTMLSTVGFYVGAERTVPIEPAVAATFFSIVDEEGKLNITADQTAIQSVVDTLPALVNRAPVNAESIINASGDVLKELTVGVNGRTLGDTSTVASDFAQQLEAGNAVQPLEVTEVPFATATLMREIDINLANQSVSVLENGVVVDSWYVSAGAGANATHTGSFEIGWKTSSQNMGNRDLTKAPNYFQPDVKWVMYFNGDEALHGVYWHSNWGTAMSHGCVGMPEDRAQWLYNWAPEGVNVYVHY
ncbi:ErfK/YbiS/YcfS/YnhG family protein [Microbacterium sp. CH12i]|uniref:L,D-transpeptidase family protein n=1 Tax=Microbacterium sp. CH12i TaxID=1479651 RepID=UPI0004612A86|nr:L,D-transpeptidase family protein [Microbacterium sp. CH12i]KDA06441.1 ErfK/YbiS/YcfS/YnhG family protein [Microbacterium sp. CH12i]